MFKFNGLFFKTMLLVNGVALISWLFSYLFITSQQELVFSDEVADLKRHHHIAAQLLVQGKVFDTHALKQLSPALAELSPAMKLLAELLGSTVGIISPSIPVNDKDLTLQRFPFDSLSGLQRNAPLLQTPLDQQALASLYHDGLSIEVQNNHYFVWLDTISGIDQNIKLLFISDVSDTFTEQTRYKRQVVVMIVVMSFGISLILFLCSIIPMSQIMKLRSAIEFIGKKEYHLARQKMGNVSRSLFNDELDDLEHEFRSALDILENYEHELLDSHKKLVRQATIDSITGLFTRNVLVEDIRRHHKQKIAIFFIDLDGFKPVNDNLGHEAGDIMLKKIGFRLKGVTNKSIKVYRIGGDEFVIAYFDYPEEANLQSMASSVVSLLNAPFTVYDTSIAISASIGVALKGEDKLEPDKLLRFADIAMYQAKKEGKNRFKFFNESMHASTKLRFSIKNDFKAHLNKGFIFVVFQPIVAADSRKVIKCEALCRWQHPDLGFISPVVFISVLEESEHINALFTWMLNKVVDEILYFDSIGQNELIISINLSAAQLVDNRAIEILLAAIKDKGIGTHRLELEITETTLISNFKRAKQWIMQVKDLGFRVAIDDFGAGYSSLSYLSTFSYDTVKLDRSLLDKIDSDIKQQRIVKSLVQMLHGLEVSIVAEGAETEVQFTTLARYGCDYIQGFYISKPVPHEQLVQYLLQQNAKG